MKPFWPFKMVEGAGKPGVTPIYTGGCLRTFSTPTLPNDFKWEGERIEFRLDFSLTSEGRAHVQKHFVYGPQSNQFDKNDWRMPAVRSAMAAVESWKFYPLMADDKAVQSGGGWNFIITKKDGVVRWIIKDDIHTVYDNLPREEEN